MKQYYGHRPIKIVDVDNYTRHYVCETCGKTVKVHKSPVSFPLLRMWHKEMMDTILKPSAFERFIKKAQSINIEDTKKEIKTISDAIASGIVTIRKPQVYVVMGK